MNNSASESGVRGREQHPNLTEVEKIKAVKGKMNDALFEFMQCATVLGLSCFVMMSTGKDGEEIVHCDDFSMIKAMGAVTDKVNGDGNSNQINPVIRQMNQSMRGENDAYLGKLDKTKLTIVHETLNSKYKAPSEKKPSTGKGVTTNALEDGIVDWHERGYDKFTPGTRNYLNRNGDKLSGFGSKVINATDIPRPFPQGSKVSEPLWYKTNILGQKRKQTEQLRCPTTGRMKGSKTVTE